MKENQLNNLFESVRDQSPSYSYEAIEQSFLASAAVAQPSSVLEKISNLSNITKIIIMISTIVTLGTIITLHEPDPVDAFLQAPSAIADAAA